MQPLEARRLAEAAVEWLLSQKLPAGDGVVSRMDRAGHYAATPVGWCYGDLGVSLVLLSAGRHLRRQGWEHEAILCARVAADLVPERAVVQDQTPSSCAWTFNNAATGVIDIGAKARADSTEGAAYAVATVGSVILGGAGIAAVAEASGGEDDATVTLTNDGSIAIHASALANGAAATSTHSTSALADPLIHAVRLDQAQERLARQVELADRRLHVPQHRPRRRACEGGVNLTFELVERREPVAVVCVAELVHEPCVAVERADMRTQRTREEHRADREVLAGGTRCDLGELHVAILA